MTIRTTLLTGHNASYIERALEKNRPIDQPLTTTEKWVLNVLLSPMRGEPPPDEETKQRITLTMFQTEVQWTMTLRNDPSQAELIQAVNSFLYGNLCERAVLQIPIERNQSNEH